MAIRTMYNNDLYFDLSFLIHVHIYNQIKHKTFLSLKKYKYLNININGKGIDFNFFKYKRFM